MPEDQTQQPGTDDLRPETIAAGTGPDDDLEPVSAAAAAPAETPEPKRTPTPSGTSADAVGGSTADGTLAEIPPEVLGRKVMWEGREVTVAEIVRNQDELNRLLTRAEQTRHYQEQLETARKQPQETSPERREPSRQEVLSYGMQRRWAQRSAQAQGAVSRMAAGDWEGSPVPQKVREELTEMSQAYPGFMAQATAAFIGLQELEQAFAEMVLDMEDGRSAAARADGDRQLATVQQRFGAVLDQLATTDPDCEGLKNPDVRKQFAAFVGEMFDETPLSKADAILTPENLASLFVGRFMRQTLRQLASQARSATAPAKPAAAASPGVGRRGSVDGAVTDFERELEAMENA